MGRKSILASSMHFHHYIQIVEELKRDSLAETCFHAFLCGNPMNSIDMKAFQQNIRFMPDQLRMNVTTFS